MNLNKLKHFFHREPGNDLHSTLRLLRRENHWGIARAMGCALCWFFSICALLFWIATSLGGTREALPLMLSIFLLVLGTILLPPSRSAALHHLRQQRDVRSVGVLIDSIPYATGSKAHDIHQLLTDLLPQLRTSDRAWLARRHLRRLYAALLLGNADTQYPYLRAIITALEHIGDADTARRLQQFVERGAVTPAQHLLMAAAQNALLRLQARLTHDHIGATLLRPSAPSDTPTELLRPASAAPDADTDTLLHPVEVQQ